MPLGLTLLGPVIVNILFYDIFLDRSGLGLGIVGSAHWRCFCCGLTTQRLLRGNNQGVIVQAPQGAPCFIEGNVSHPELSVGAA